jgi:hypothetical protein
MNNNYKLTIELVPETSFFTNVRSEVSKEEWDIIRKKSYRRANYKCEICDDTGLNQGYKHPVECHEIWLYDETTFTQILTGLISLCPNCHKTKHVGLAQINGEEDIVIEQLKKVNNMTSQEAIRYIDDAFVTWKQRSQHQWKLDISMLDLYKK